MIKGRRKEVGGRTYWTVGRTPAAATRRATVHLLPIYDEYLVAYRDRDAVPHAAGAIHSRSRGTVTFQHAVIVAGQVAGTWKTVRTRAGVLVDVIPLERLSRLDRSRLAEVSSRYGRFLDLPVSFSVA